MLVILSRLGSISIIEKLHMFLVKDIERCSFYLDETLTLYLSPQTLQTSWVFPAFSFYKSRINAHCRETELWFPIGKKYYSTGTAKENVFEKVLDSPSLGNRRCIYRIFIPFMMLCTSFRLPLILLCAEELSPSLNFMSIQNFKSSIEDFWLVKVLRSTESRQRGWEEMQISCDYESYQCILISHDLPGY